MLPNRLHRRGWGIALTFGNSVPESTPEWIRTTNLRLRRPRIGISDIAAHAAPIRDRHRRKPVRKGQGQLRYSKDPGYILSTCDGPGYPMLHRTLHNRCFQSASSPFQFDNYARIGKLWRLGQVVGDYDIPCHAMPRPASLNLDERQDHSKR